ncbi:MAG: MBL fold metallo-hydrolase [Candidatus Poribacteria bacterium]|nr:MBL fold metallo-hydrolase [Candidatus Poribacteria bacterium]
MEMVQLTDQLFVHHGCANVGVLWQSPDQSGQVLLIDCGDGQVGQQLKQPDDLEISHILMTHHHRDSASGVVGLTTEQTRIYVPEQERPYFEAVEQFWNDPEFRWHLYNYHPHHLLLSESISVTDGLKAGDQLQFGQTQITAIETPGHTDGSLSYLVESGNRRIVFSGDYCCDASSSQANIAATVLSSPNVMYLTGSSSPSLLP